MNIWKLTTPTIEGSLVAIIIALTPGDARKRFQDWLVFNDRPVTTMICRQIGVASTDLRVPEIICVSTIINTHDQMTREFAWECNECGSQEFTMSVLETDVQNLGCGNCGASEWHKAPKT